MCICKRDVHMQTRCAFADVMCICKRDVHKTRCAYAHVMCVNEIRINAVA